MTSLFKNATDVVSSPYYADILLFEGDQKLKLNLRKLTDLHLRNSDNLLRELAYYLLSFQFPDLWKEYAKYVRKNKAYADTTYFHDLCRELATTRQKNYLIPNDILAGDFTHFDVKNALLKARYGRLNLTEFFAFNKDWDSFENVAVYRNTASPFLWDVTFLMLVLQHYDEDRLKKVINYAKEGKIKTAADEDSHYLGT